MTISRLINNGGSRAGGLSRPAFFLFAFCALAFRCPATAHDIKLATWNLNWLTIRALGDPELPADVRPRQAADFVRLQEASKRLNADVIAFEEVDGVAAAARVFDPAQYTLVTIDETVVQRVGLALRHDITMVRHPDVAALDVEPYAPHRLRDGFDATLTFSGGVMLRVLVVHLKTGCHTDDLAHSTRPQCALLALQIPVLAAWIRAREAEGVPFALMGDFNRDLDRPEAMQAALDRAGALTRVTQGQSDPCWDGGAFIDHIFLGGTARQWLEPGSLRVLTYHTTDAADRNRLSDHCPVSVRIEPR